VEAGAIAGDRRVRGAGNPGMAGIATCLQLKGAGVAQLLAAAETIDADLTVVGPEVPLVPVWWMRSARRPAHRGTEPGSGATGRQQVFSKNFLVQRNIPRPRS